MAQQTYQGKVTNLYLEKGLFFHSKDIYRTADVFLERVPSEGLTIVIPLAGKVDVNYGHARLQTARHCHASPVIASMVNLTSDSLVSGVGEAGSHDRNLLVRIEPEWLEGRHQSLESPQVSQLIHGKRALHQAKLPSHLVHLAEAVNQLPGQGVAERQVMASFVELLWQFLAGLESLPLDNARAFRSTTRLQMFLQSGEADYLSVAEIGEQLGMSVATLQRHCRAAFGQSLVNYLKHRRLQRAHDAMCQEGLSLIEASLLAGYDYPANFVTAYKRYFGQTPKQHQKQAFSLLSGHV
ncbi:helix-turn-helix transcriptional regulator [Thaumasiovibrio subtropicus]|uniref:helix-turn-helix transcriptional regulator n=1 Tax=Thaumasiovibrio subtropicus TaxID=1891207 RepID=UPI00131B9917|nr:AraC family transcriptional regulator [Thaumasiovibrio subtropicus]